MDEGRACAGVVRRGVELFGCRPVYPYDSTLEKLGRPTAGLASREKAQALARADDILVARCQEGDKKAFELLVKKYERRIFHLIYRMTQDPSAVEPLAQEVFLKAYRALPSFRGQSQFYTWIYRIAINTCLSYTKRGHTEESCEVEADVNTLAPPGEASGAHLEDPEQHLMRKEFYAQVLEAVQKLPEELRVSIILREFLGLNYEEIAEVAQIPLGTVRSRIFRGRARLRELLGPFLDKPSA